MPDETLNAVIDEILASDTGTGELSDTGWRYEIMTDRKGRKYYGRRKGSGKNRQYRYGGTFSQLTQKNPARAQAYRPKRK